MRTDLIAHLSQYLRLLFWWSFGAIVTGWFEMEVPGYSEWYRDNIHAVSASVANHKSTIAAAPMRLVGRSILRSASALNSFIKPGGISRTVSRIPAGTITISSRYPSTGTKSGIRSMGLNAYAATAAATSLAYQGTRGSRAAIHTAMASRLIVRARCFARCNMVNILIA